MARAFSAALNFDPEMSTMSRFDAVPIGVLQTRRDEIQREADETEEELRLMREDAEAMTKEINSRLAANS